MEPELASILDDLRMSQARVCVLTGAGISQESGIPTFRGQDGYWVVGSAHYMPEEMATWRMFRSQPEQVWCWYLYRFGLCQGAQPNPAHHALVRLEEALGARFGLVTQNIDGLHLRAGSSSERTFCIHGEAARVRCAGECGLPIQALPTLATACLRRSLSSSERSALTCPRCQDWLRPHVLWFDECYDEVYYRAESALRAADEADLLLVVGTSGATSLPRRIGDGCWRRGATIIDVNPDANPFSQLAMTARRGFWAKGSASQCLGPIVDRLIGSRNPLRAG